MRTATGVVGILLVGLVANTLAHSAAVDSTVLDPRGVYQKSLESVLTLIATRPDGSRSIGSAFLAVREGAAVTAWHVVSGASSVTARASNGEEFEVSGLIDRDVSRDVALVRVKSFGRPVILVDSKEPSVGARVYVIGAPKGLEFSLSEGLVSQFQVLDGQRLIQYTSASSPGNSGGPLLDAKGHAIGVVSSQMREGQNLNFAVPIVAVLALDSSLPTQPWVAVAASRATSVKTEADNPAADQLLGRSLCALLDLNTASSITGSNVLAKPGGFAGGVPAYLYRAREDGISYAESLSALQTLDPVRERARQSIATGLRTLTDSSDLLVDAIRLAQAGGGWGADANDKLSRCSAVLMKLTWPDTATLRPLVLSEAFSGAVSAGTLSRFGIGSVGPEFSLGVHNWTRDEVFIADVTKNSLASRLGLKAGDRILTVNDAPVLDLNECKRALLSLQGQTCWLNVMREGKRTRLPPLRLSQDFLH